MCACSCVCIYIYMYIYQHIRSYPKYTSPEKMKSSNTGKCVYACNQADKQAYNIPTEKNHVCMVRKSYERWECKANRAIAMGIPCNTNKIKKMEIKMKSPNQLKGSSMSGGPLDHLLLLPTFVLQATLAHFRSTAQIDWGFVPCWASESENPRRPSRWDPVLHYMSSQQPGFRWLMDPAFWNVAVLACPVHYQQRKMCRYVHSPHYSVPKLAVAPVVRPHDC